MFYYEDMKSDVLFSAGSNNYICKCWTGVSARKIEKKEIVIITTQCYDEWLHDFINSYGEFNIEFTTSVKNSDFEEEFSLTNLLQDMSLLLHQSSFKSDSISEHIFVFGNEMAVEQDAVDILNQELKEDIINEVVKKILKEI